MAKLKVVVVDDSPMFRELAVRELSAAGFEVVPVESPLTLPGAVVREHPDVVLLDVAMPALGGDRLANLLRKQGAMQSAAVIFWSERPDAELRHLVEATGIDGFVRKSVTNEVLVAEVRKFAELARGRREAAGPKV